MFLYLTDNVGHVGKPFTSTQQNFWVRIFEMVACPESSRSRTYV